MKAIYAISVTLYIIMLVAASLQILMRFIFQNPLAWTDELAKYSFIWGTMLGCAYLVRTKGHSSVELLGSILKGIAKKMQLLLLDILCLILYTVIIIGGISLVKAGLTSVSPALGVPLYLVNTIMPLSGALMLLFQLENLLDNLKGKSGK